jgi:hypothetical protein
MAGVTKAQLRHLTTYLEGDAPNEIGEWGMHCPLHHDATRSASLNTETGLWFCQVCEIGGSVDDLIERMKEGGSNVAYFSDPSEIRTRRNGSSELPSEAKVKGWHSALLSNAPALAEFQSRRGLSLETLIQFEIGWSVDDKAYTIPIRDINRQIVNVRFYQLDPSDERRKIWSVMGHGTPTLYPISILEENSEIIVCEGELDALLTVQNGFPAVTRTGAAKVWREVWNDLFADKCVYVCHDMDDPGQLGNHKVMVSLKDIAAEVKIVMLPYRVIEKHGKDLTDYWLAGFSGSDFKDLLNDSKGVTRDPDLVAQELVDVSLLDSFDAGLSGSKLRMRVTITGKQTPAFLIPQDVEFFCTQDAGPKCQICPMNEWGGEAARHIGSQEPAILKMMKATDDQVQDILRDHIKAQKCTRMTIDVKRERTVEVIHVRPSVEVSTNWEAESDHTSRQIISVGSHNAEPNSTVEVVGTVYPDPRSQQNTFQAWELVRTVTSLDRFRVTPEIVESLKVFRNAPKEEPLTKCVRIAEELASVTKIVGRHKMQVLMDLVWHSALSFYFDGVRQKRGWVEALIIGDTRTGKSEAADRLRQWYAAGEMVSCESATFAGIVGGLQQYGGKEWIVTWGAVPLNDRRLVVLDEISGLETDQIAQMSSIRSSGEAQLTKIRNETTWARTRLLWMGNPRNAKLDDFTYDMQALKPLIGNPEDIARFDLVMSVRKEDVSADEINQPRTVDHDRAYSQEACQALVRWVWSRTAEQVIWDEDAEAAVYEAARDLGGKYVEDPPLIQGANVRIKIARLAVAIAARTFSSDHTGEVIMVLADHVSSAVRLIQGIYADPHFGYGEISSEQMEDVSSGTEQLDRAKEFMHNNKELSRFLRLRAGPFRRQDLEDVLGIDREQATAMINQLWKFKLLEKQGPDIKMRPAMHGILRELREMAKEKGKQNGQ